MGRAHAQRDAARPEGGAATPAAAARAPAGSRSAAADACGRARAAAPGGQRRRRPARARPAHAADAAKLRKDEPAELADVAEGRADQGRQPLGQGAHGPVAARQRLLSRLRGPAERQPLRGLREGRARRRRGQGRRGPRHARRRRRLPAARRGGPVGRGGRGAGHRPAGARPRGPAGRQRRLRVPDGHRPRLQPVLREAETYFVKHVPAATIVKDVRSLKGILERVQAADDPVANLYIVSHAHPDGTLQFSLDDLDKTPGQLQYEELLDDLGRCVALPKVNRRQIGAWTHVHIKGCASAAASPCSARSARPSAARRGSPRRPTPSTTRAAGRRWRARSSSCRARAS